MWTLSILSFAISALYWPGIAGAATTPRWSVMAVAIPFLLKPHRVTVTHLWGLSIIGLAAASMLWNPAPLDGVGALLSLCILAGCFCFGNQLDDLRPLYIGAGLGLWVSSIIAMLQFFGFAVLPTYTPVSGLFVNGNFMSEAAALLVVAAVAERIWWLVPGLLPALFLTDARGAILACTMGLMVHYRRKWRWLIGIMIVMAAAAVVLTTAKIYWPGIDERLLIWESTWNGLTFFGHGIGSFWTTYPQFDLRAHPWSMPEYAHNEFLTVAFELGVIGFALFVGFWLTLIGPINTSRLILIALLMEACFAFPTHLPTTGFIGLVAAGHAVRSRYLLRDLVMRRRGVGARGRSIDGLSNGPGRRYQGSVAIPL